VKFQNSLVDSPSFACPSLYSPHPPPSNTQVPRAEETADAGANDQGELAQPLEEVRRYVPTPPPSPGETAAGPRPRK